MHLQLLELPVRVRFWKKIGILANRWCVFLSTILLPNESVRSLMHATIVLIANQES